MSSLEEAFRKFPAGVIVIALSLLVGALGAAPLLLYVAFGPADGNPIGLGLLFVASVPLAGLGVLLGAIIIVAQLLWRRRG